MTILRALLPAPPRGTALVEFGLAFPFILILLVGVVDFGLGFYEGLQVQGAAEAGAQYATAHGFDSTNISAAVCTASGASSCATSPFTLSTGYPKEVCGCPTASGGVTNQTAPDPTSGACTSTCGAGTPQGVYAVVSAYLNYTPMMPYPGLTSPVKLTGVAYRRLQ